MESNNPLSTAITYFDSLPMRQLFTAQEVVNYLVELQGAVSLPTNSMPDDVAKYEGVLLGLKICKEMWAQGQISHENIYENEVYYRELLENAKRESAPKTVNTSKP